MKKNNSSISDLANKKVTSVKREADKKRTIGDVIADKANAFFGSNVFLYGNLIWFIGWILINVNLIPGVKAFDPFPFDFLTTAVSLEAIILSIFVLISQNRAAKIIDIREETELQVNIVTEKELTKMMHLLTRLLEKNGIDIEKDKKLQEMLKQTDTEALKKKIEKQIEN